MKKQIISIFLSVCIVAALLPLTKTPAYAAESGEIPADTAAIFAQDSIAPADYNTVTDPYNLAGTGMEKVLSSQDEILLAVTDTNSMAYTGFDTYNTKVESSEPSFYLKDNYFNWTQTESSDWTGNRYLQSVAFDSDGNGTKESAAYIAYRDGDKNVICWWYNARTNSLHAPIVIGSANELVHGTHGLPTLTANYQALNFFRITAGDYDNDGRDSIVVYAAVDGNTPALYELEVSSNGDNLEKKTGENLTELLSYDYKRKNTMRESKYYNDRLSADLASGDLNGDGIDDLAVLTYTNDSWYEGDTWGLYTPYLAVSYGDSKSGHGIPNRCDTWDYVHSEKSDNLHHYVPIAPNLAIGNVDGNGCNELIIAGYYGETNSSYNNNGTWVEGRTATKLNVFTYNANNNRLQQRKFQQLDANAWLIGDAATNGVWLNSDYVWQPLAAECAALDGPAKAESVFIGGTVYNWDGDHLTEAFTSHYFNEIDSGDLGMGISVPFISSVISGNFSGSIEGYEQFVFTVGLKGSSAARYHFIPGIIGKYGNDSSRQFYGSNPGSANTDDEIIIQSGDVMAALAAVDNDDDLVKIRYNTKSFAWDDPKVVAVLQAAPYFGELGDYSDFDNGATEYSIGSSYEREGGTSNSQSLGAGAVLSVNAAVVSAEIKAGYSGEWSSSSFDTTGTEQTYSVSATAYNTVIVQRTPIYQFSYDLYNTKTGQWEKNGYNLCVTRKSSYFPLSINEYNAFTEVYNRKTHKNFSEITNKNVPSLIGNEGNPYAYTADLGTILSQASANLSYNASSQSMSYVKSYGHGESTESSNGFSFELSVTAGTPVVSGGGYLSTEFKWGHSSTETRLNSTETAGTVADLDVVGLSESLGVSENLIRQYGFTWSFGTWNLDLCDAGKVPVYGYNLTNITSPTPRVTDLSYKVSDNGDSLHFDWSAPYADIKNANKPDGYYLYVSKGDGKLKKHSDTIITDTSYTLTEFDRTKGYTFAVTAASKKFLPDGEHFSYIEGVPSNICVYNGDLSGKSAYELAVEKGYTGTLDEWLSSLTGKKGEKGDSGASGANGKSAYELAVEKGYTGTLDEWLTSLKGEAGKSGTDGLNGKSAYELAVEKGYNGTLDEWLASLIGAKGEKGDKGEAGIPGKDGKDGPNGKSAYELAVEKGYTGTLDEWLSSLTGKKGEKGDSGASGANGKSAYELAVEKGYTGTLDEWLTSLKGEAGKSGIDGLNGSDGKDGMTGNNGKDGADGQTPYIGENGNWWIGNKDTGKTAVAVSVTDISVDDDGHLVFTMSDGSSMNAIIPDGFAASSAAVNESKDETDVSTRNLAVTGVTISSAAMLWNIITLVITMIRRKKANSVGI